MSKQGHFVAKTLLPPAQWPVLEQRAQQIPHSAAYTIQRYDALSVQAPDEGGLFVYQQTALPGEEAFIELRFVVNGLSLSTQDAGGKPHVVVATDFVQIKFPPAYLLPFTQQQAELGQRNDAILSFVHPHSFASAFPLNTSLRRCLEGLLQPAHQGAMANIFENALLQSLLVHGLDTLHHQPVEAPAFQCKFLADAGGRDRILAARDILLQHIGNPITIKELSRKVAINECYLKKGFKEVFGTTIFDFYQQQRMEHAKFLLHEKGLSVTDVSDHLGYSSISHFSAAFKRHTGIKPCELLR